MMKNQGKSWTPEQNKLLIALAKGNTPTRDKPQDMKLVPIKDKKEYRNNPPCE